MEVAFSLFVGVGGESSLFVGHKCSNDLQPPVVLEPDVELVVGVGLWPPNVGHCGEVAEAAEAVQFSPEDGNCPFWPPLYIFELRSAAKLAAYWP